MHQLSLTDFEISIENIVSESKKVQLFPLEEYDHIIVSASAGKDSMVCLFKLLDLGVPTEKIELWHQSIDGKKDHYFEFMDWPVTESYVEAAGEHFGIKTAYQWRAKGIYGELLRKESLTGDVYYCENGNIIHLPTKNGKETTRLKWPAMSPNLRVRWCSPYVKIDVFRRVLNNHPRFQGTLEQPKKVLVLTGERREESPNRAKYLECEVHPCSNKKRIVHAWRPVIDYSEQAIWDMYEKRRFLPHPAYLLGWNRTSCFGCIFSTADLWAMMREIAPERFYRLAEMEKELNHTIDTNRLTLEEKANLGSTERLPKDKRLSKWVKLALSRNFNKSDLIMDKFEIPAGAFRGNTGGPS
ncbi:phosphoadenosine phosphosulfate reductase domain-containing protein [Mesobacillus zeae]|uniref:phosphoadenosine phosphosulfate reductase domain-containing protein n=1 Tax=Mesobacillus zeae TaxID=1917180 RepID=UPI0030094EEC